MHWFWLTAPLSCGASISYAHCPLAAPPTSFLNTECSFTLLLLPVEGPFPSPFSPGELLNLPDSHKVTPGNLNAPCFHPLFHVLLW